MMGHRIKLNGDEIDAVSRFRHYLSWRPGSRSATKRQVRRRERKMARRSLQNAD